jgi:hypothetical protein
MFYRSAHQDAVTTTTHTPKKADGPREVTLSDFGLIRTCYNVSSLGEHVAPLCRWMVEGVDTCAICYLYRAANPWY